MSKESIAVIGDFTGIIPGLSLTTYWALLELDKAGIPCYALSRGGIVSMPGVEGAPPAGFNVKRALFVGDPKLAVEFENRNAEMGLEMLVLASGVTPSSVPLAPSTLSSLKWVGAYKETAEWLHDCGVESIGLKGPVMPFDETFEEVEKDENKLCVLHCWNSAGEPLVAPPRSMVDVRSIGWTIDNEPITIKKLLPALRWADVLVRDYEMLDDPMAILAQGLGVPVVSRTPQEGFWSRVVAAARMKRDGVTSEGRLDVSSGDYTLVDAVRRAIEGEELMPRAPKSPTEAKVRLAVVIPFGGLDRSILTDCIDSLEIAGAKEMHIPIIVAHQKGEDEASFDAADVGVDVVTEHARGGKWNLSLARNVGALVALHGGFSYAGEADEDEPTHGMVHDQITHVVFLDADVDVMPGFLEMVENEIRAKGSLILVPYCQNESGKVRIASGLAIYPRRLLEKTGFDESFVGWGYEDLEFIRRARDEHGIPSVLIGTATNPALFHRDHEQRWKETIEENHERYAGPRKE